MTGERRRCAALASVLFALGAVLLSAGPAGSSTERESGELWVARYNGPGDSLDVAKAIALSPDGSTVFVTGCSFAVNLKCDYATAAYDAVTGTELWVERYNGPADDNDTALSIAASPDGSSVFVTGESTGVPATADYLTIAYDASTGSTRWTQRFTGRGFDEAFSVAVSPDGSKVFVTGQSDSSRGDSDFATLAYDAGTGAPLWLSRYNGRGTGGDGAVSVGVSPEGSKVYVTGWSYGSGIVNVDYATIAYDAATGSPIWVGRYDDRSQGEDSPTAMAVSPDGSKVFVTGLSEGPTGRYDYVTVAWDAVAGAPLWLSRYNGTNNGDDYANSLAVAPDGSNVFVTGSSYGGSGPSYDYATVAYDGGSGAPRWLRRYNGPGDDLDEASSVAVAPDGSMVFVTGYSVGAGSSADYGTLAYEAASGRSLGVRRYDGPGDSEDRANVVAVSPDGARVYVTGESDGAPNNPDYATVAYEV